MAAVSPTPRLTNFLEKCSLSKYSNTFKEKKYFSMDHFYYSERKDQEQIIGDLNIDNCDVPKFRMMMNMIWSQQENKEKTKKVKRSIIDISASPTPPKMSKEENECNQNQDIIQNASNIQYYRDLCAELGTKAKYDVNEEILFFIPYLAESGDYVDRIGIIEKDEHPNYHIVDKRDTSKLYIVGWHLILKSEQAHNALLDVNNNDCIQNNVDNESANLSIAISPIPTNDNSSFISSDRDVHLLDSESEYNEASNVSIGISVSNSSKRKNRYYWTKNDESILRKLHNEMKAKRKYENVAKNVYITALHKAFNKKASQSRTNEAIRNKVLQMELKRPSNCQTDDEDCDNVRRIAHCTRSKTKVFVLLIDCFNFFVFEITEEKKETE